MFLLMTTGCAPTLQRYKGPPRPDNEIAVVHCTGEYIVKALDDEDLWGADESMRGAHLEVLPGEHTISFRHENYLGSVVTTYVRSTGQIIDKKFIDPWTEAKFVAQPGREYDCGRGVQLRGSGDCTCFADTDQVSQVDLALAAAFGESRSRCDDADMIRRMRDGPGTGCEPHDPACDAVCGSRGGYRPYAEPDSASEK